MNSLFLLLVRVNMKFLVVNPYNSRCARGVDVVTKAEIYILLDYWKNRGCGHKNCN